MNNNNITLDWATLRTQIRDKQKLQEEWEYVIQMFHNRVIDRYFSPIDFLLSSKEKSKGEGFSILTIECALIEFIASTVNGMVFNFDGTKRKSYLYTNSSKWYIRFLNEAYIFEGYFFGINNFIKAHEFYKDVRCALIHEAQTRNGWTVSIYNKNKEEDKKNEILFENKVIYRTALNSALKKYFIEFCREAKEETPKGRKYRKFIARRFDIIHEIEPDNSFWW